MHAKNASAMRSIKRSATRVGMIKSARFDERDEAAAAAPAEICGLSSRKAQHSLAISALLLRLPQNRSVRVPAVCRPELFAPAGRCKALGIPSDSCTDHVTHLDVAHRCDDDSNVHPGLRTPAGSSNRLPGAHKSSSSQSPHESPVIKPLSWQTLCA